MQRVHCFLILACLFSWCPDITAQALSLVELRTLISTGIEATVVEATIAQKGLGSHITPAVLKWLSAEGMDFTTKTALLNVATSAAGKDIASSEDQATWIDIKELAVRLRRPLGFDLKVTPGRWQLSTKRAASTTTAEVEIRVWPLNPSILQGKDAERQVLQDLLPDQVESLVKNFGYEHQSSRIMACRGITGVQAQLSRAKVGEFDTRVQLSLLSRRNQLMVVRSVIRGNEDDPWVKQTTSAINAILGDAHTASPPSASLELATRIAALESLDGIPRLILLKRSGERVTAPFAKAPSGLIADPLNRFVAWREPNSMASLRSGKVERTPVPKELVRSAQFTILPGHERPEFISFPDDLLKRWAKLRVLSPLLTGSGALVATPSRNHRGSHFGRWFFGASQVDWLPSGDFEPSYALEAIPDPGSNLELVAHASDHYPIPSQSPAPATTVWRLFYSERGQSKNERFLLQRELKGPFGLAPHHIHFLPSAQEIIFVDPARGICTLPRDGGIPVLLVPGKFIALAPFAIAPT